MRPRGCPPSAALPRWNRTLTADTSNIDDGNGLTNVSYAYQWLAAGTAISGAIGSSYTLTANEQGNTIQVRVDFEDDAGNSESLTSVATDAVAAKPVPLTATFSNVPDSHSGSGEFTFDLAFSENFPLSYRTPARPRVHRRRQRPGHQGPTQGAGQQPDLDHHCRTPGNGAITITLPATTDCAATGAICTDDGRMLSHSTSVSIAGPE